MVTTPTWLFIWPPLIFPPLAALSSPSWPLIWMLLEINMFSYLVVLLFQSSPIATETTVKYFIAQAPRSSVILLSAISFTHTKSLISLILLIRAVVFKIGMAPFHQWFLSVAKGLKTIPFTLLLTWQKLMPLCLIFLYGIPLKIINILIILNALIGAMGGVGQTLIRPLLCFSSINHTAWIILAIKASTLVFLTYTRVYFLIIFSLITSIAEDLPLNHWAESRNHKTVKKIPIFSTALLSLAGIPPLIGFTIKWIVLFNNRSDLFVVITLILGSIVTLLYYIKITLVLTFKTAHITRPLYNKTTITLILINYTGPILLLLIL